MPWTYLKIDADGERLPDSPELPGPQTVYLGFDVCRKAVVLGYTERGGYHSMLSPNVNDDCNIIAFVRNSAATLTVASHLSSGGTTLNVSGGTTGLWSPRGGASPGNYQLIMGDKVWMQVGLMISGYTRNCYKEPGSWCDDTGSNYYRLSGEGNGVQNGNMFNGVALRQNGHRNVASQLMSVGVR